MRPSPADEETAWMRDALREAEAAVEHDDVPVGAVVVQLSTGDVVASATDQANRDKVMEFAARADVQKSFESMALTAANAKDRVNAMTQEEVNRIAGKIDSMPAGASSNGWWWAVAVIVVGLVIWYAYK